MDTTLQESQRWKLFFVNAIVRISYESNNDIAILSGGYLLNEDFEGGEFIINDKKLDTPIGSIFTFGRNEMHEVNPVTKGTRYSLHFVVNKPKPKKTLL